VHVDEVVTDASLVRRLLVAQFPRWAQLPIEPITPAGTDNAVYRLGRRLAVRVPRIPAAASQPGKEHRWLPRLAPLLPLEIPVPLALGEPAEGYPWQWSVVRWLDGETATASPIVDLGRAARDLARFIRALQQADAEGGPDPGPENSDRGAPLADRDSETRAAIAAWAGDRRRTPGEARRAEGGTASGALRDRDALTAVWRAALDAPQWSDAPVWLHGDLDARNLLVRNGRLSAVVDFGCLGVGDPAYDVALAWKVLTVEVRESFRAELAVDDATWTRSRGLALS
jgi:aminoglycoside phosphotransferase (APT) family kinase protein